jgi:GT2 family glycosyltransferase
MAKSIIVFVVIPTWNLKDDVVACVHSVLHSTCESLRVVVVDDASTDGTLDALRMTFGTAIDVIRLDQNVGFARALNHGIDFALKTRAEFILVLNNDTIINAQMVEMLIQVLQTRPAAGIAGPVIYYHDYPEQVWHTGDRQLGGPPFTWRIAARERLNVCPVDVDYVTGCAMLIKREVFTSVGLFDEDYQMYFEDADFCWRARRAGFRIVIAPLATMTHKVSRSTYHAPSSRIYRQTRGRTIFLNRCSPPLLQPVAHLYICARAVSEAAFNLFARRPDSARSVIAGTLDGYRFVWAHWHK